MVSAVARLAAVTAVAAGASACGGESLEDELRRDLGNARDPVTDVRCENEDRDYASCTVVYRSGFRQRCAVATRGDDGGACTPPKPAN